LMHIGMLGSNPEKIVWLYMNFCLQMMLDFRSRLYIQKIKLRRESGS